MAPFLLFPPRPKQPIIAVPPLTWFRCSVFCVLSCPPKSVNYPPLPPQECLPLKFHWRRHSPLISSQSSRGTSSLPLVTCLENPFLHTPSSWALLSRHPHWSFFPGSLSIAAHEPSLPPKVLLTAAIAAEGVTTPSRHSVPSVLHFSPSLGLFCHLTLLEWGKLLFFKPLPSLLSTLLPFLRRVPQERICL